MRLKKSSFWSKIPNWVWVLISLAVAIAIWLFAAYTWPLVFATPKAVVDAFISKAASGVLWGHVWASLSRVLSGFAIAFVVSILDSVYPQHPPAGLCVPDHRSTGCRPGQ